MKIALIIPINGYDNKKSFYDYKFYSKFLFSKKYHTYLLVIPAIISLTPPGHEIRVFDENIEKIDYTWKADLVGISVRTMLAERAYAISENYQKRGVKTVLGGIHPSMCPEEAREHCDSVVVGEAELVWANLIIDAEKGQLKKQYRAEGFSDLKKFPLPNRSALAQNKYFLDIVQSTKGCPFQCEFCSVYAFDGQKLRKKTINQVVQEIQTIKNSGSQYKKKNSILFADDNIIANKQFAYELFNALKPLNMNTMCQATINISQDEPLLKLMRKSGCGAVFIGLESISEKNLAHMNKNINQRFKYVEAIQKIQSFGILVQGSFILGYDFDSQSSFDELIDFIEESHLLMPLINILTPFPGTELFKRFEKEGKILHKNWSKYDTKHVVFSPNGMTPEELFEGYRKVVRSVYSFDSILKRLYYYWGIDFWKYSNKEDPVKFFYRFLFAFRLCTFLVSTNLRRSLFILKILPKVFRKRTRISTILALMHYNDFAYSL